MCSIMSLMRIWSGHKITFRVGKLLRRHVLKACFVVDFAGIAGAHITIYCQS